MKVTDYIVEFLQGKGIKDCFGYPGGVICHLIDSLSKFDGIRGHINYNEQGAAFAACGYAQAFGKPGVAFSTSGPGATNLITGIANAYFDSIPCIFITGQVDTYALSEGYPIRQRGFQETNVVSMVKDITKWAVRVDKPESIRYVLEKAYYIATSGNPGPVLLDLPADIQRADINIENVEKYAEPIEKEINYDDCVSGIVSMLLQCKRPVIIAGNGIKQSNMKVDFATLVERMGVPVVMSLPAIDLLPTNNMLNFGFIGTNGHRYANFLLGKSDLIIAIGSRLDIRQTGLSRDKFAPQAKIVRIDIDCDSLNYKVHEDDIDYCVDVRKLIPRLLNQPLSFDFSEWIDVCNVIKDKLLGYDDRDYNRLIGDICKYIPNDIIYMIDVGQHQLWFAQSGKIKERQGVHMSAGHGAMGYSIPAAIGAFYATKKTVIAICGDGGFMMNVQELQTIKRDCLPVKIICINNSSLGMIRGFQERNFEGNYQLTTETTGYLAPNIQKIAEAFDMKYSYVESANDINLVDFVDMKPEIIEVRISKNTVLEPNFGKNGFIQDQMPYLDRNIYNELMSL